MGFWNKFKGSKPSEEYQEYQSSEIVPAQQSDFSATVPNYSELPLNLTPKEQRNLLMLKHGSQAANRIAEAYEENKRINANIEALRIATSASLQQHAQKMQLLEKTIISTFSERNGALQKHYQALDYGMQTGDRNIILAALKGISDIVVENPLDDIAEISKAFKDKSLPLDLGF